MSDAERPQQLKTTKDEADRAACIAAFDAAVAVISDADVAKAVRAAYIAAFDAWKAAIAVCDAADAASAATKAAFNAAYAAADAARKTKVAEEEEPK